MTWDFLDTFALIAMSAKFKNEAPVNREGVNSKHLHLGGLILCPMNFMEGGFRFCSDQIKTRDLEINIKFKK